MATATDEKTDAAESAGELGPEAEQVAAAGRSKKIKLIGLVVGLSLLMMGVGYFFLPSSNANDPDALEDTMSEDIAIEDDTVEVEIGKFNCTNTRSGADISVHVNFNLVAEVKASNEQAFRDAEDQYQARIRDVVNRVARSASREDLFDPALDTMKREFREGINRTIRKHYIIQVHISDWQTLER